MRLHELLTESATDVLYHSTGIHNAANILRSRKFNLNQSVSRKTELEYQKKTRFFYLSTTRSKIGDYTLHNIYTSGVVFNLNGRWFNHRYKTVAVDYWDRMWLKSRAAGDLSRYSEMEDRIMSYEPEIDFSKSPLDAISEVHMLIRDGIILDELKQYIRTIILEASRAGIPLFIYDNIKNFLLQDKRKVISVETLLKSGQFKVNSKNLIKPYTSLARDYVKPYRELYYATSSKDLSSEARKRLRSIKYPYYGDDPARSLDADMQGFMRRNKSASGVEKLLKIYQKENLKSSREFLDFLKKKWEALEQKEGESN